MDMLILAASDLASYGDKALNLLFVAIGLGAVIFIHELGHFAVAKWCGVKVERFSIGFGKPLLKFNYGETEYWLAMFPLGGYVKMLGQDDADPSQLSDTRIARDPRSYTSKSVPQRMAIISAGVFNNLVSAVVFFIIAFMMGVQYNPAIVGHVIPGGPGWKAGLRAGDVITQVDDRVDDRMWFDHLRLTVALSNGEVMLGGLRDGQPFQAKVMPERIVGRDYYPVIRVEPTQSLILRNEEPALPGTGASKAKPAFEGGDELVQIDDVKIETFADLQRVLSAKRSQPIEMHVRRKGVEKPVALTVPPTRFRTVGLQMDIGKITAIQQGSPADGKLRPGDKITEVITPDGKYQIGNQLDPLELPDLFYRWADEEVTVKFTREAEKGTSIPDRVTLKPIARGGWTERPVLIPDCPLAVPAIGVSFQVLHTVMKVDPESDAAKQKVERYNIIESVAFLKGDTDKVNGKPFELAVTSWPTIFMELQQHEHQRIQLKIKDRPDLVTLQIQESENWFSPVRGLATLPLHKEYRAASAAQAMGLGVRYTQDKVAETYLTLRRLLTGQLSATSMGGPLSIFQVALHFADKGFADLILFLGMLSISLAVLNFLPIPVLDGGHFLFLLWEGIRGKPASERLMTMATYVGLAMLAALMLWVFCLDIGRLILPI